MLQLTYVCKLRVPRNVTRGASITESSFSYNKILFMDLTFITGKFFKLHKLKPVNNNAFIEQEGLSLNGG